MFRRPLTVNFGYNLEHWGAGRVVAGEKLKCRVSYQSGKDLGTKEFGLASVGRAASKQQ